jgi:hypothetical protein
MQKLCATTPQPGGRVPAIKADDQAMMVIRIQDPRCRELLSEAHATLQHEEDF